MSVQEKKFSSEEELENWLKHRGIVEGNDAREVAKILFARGANKSTRLIGIRSDQLERLGVPTLLSIELMNKLEDPEQDVHKPKDQKQDVNETMVKLESIATCMLAAGLIKNIFSSSYRHGDCFVLSWVLIVGLWWPRCRVMCLSVLWLATLNL